MRFPPLWPLAMAACLADVPPFAGEEGTGGANASSGTGTSATTGGNGGGGASSSSSAGTSTGASTTSGGPDCGLDVLPPDCDAASVVMGCAFGSCSVQDPCTEGPCDLEATCAYPAAVLLDDLHPAFCRNGCGALCGSVCDGVGAALAYIGPLETGLSQRLASFPASSLTRIRVRARGYGRFRLGWREGDGPNGLSGAADLGPEYADFEVVPPPGEAVEISIVPGVEAPSPYQSLYIEVDCVYATPEEGS